MGFIDSIKSQILGIEHFNVDHKILKGDWFVLETSPLSLSEDNEKIIFDILMGNGVYVNKNGTLKHNRDCEVDEHIISKQFEATLLSLRSQKFRFAIWPNSQSILSTNQRKILSGQPVIVPLDPEINYYIFPDHPHLNNGCMFEGTLIPQSICYTDSPSTLGSSDLDRVRNAINQAHIWLYRHQIWLASRKNGRGKWIGPELAISDKDQYSIKRNPYGQCRCGSKKQYCLCHLNEDYQTALKTKNNIDVQSYNRLYNFEKAIYDEHMIKFIQQFS